MKKIIGVFAVIFLGVTALNAQNLESFKKGFEVGLEAVNYQLNTEGYEPKVMKIEHPYAVIMDIKSVPTKTVLYLQHLLYKDGLQSITTKEFLLIKAFERMADAKELQHNIANKYNIKLKIVELYDGKIETYPTLFNNTLDTLVAKVAKDKDVSIVKTYTNPMKTRMVKKTKKAKVKYIILKNDAMTYKYEYNKASKSKVCKETNKKCFDSKFFKENSVRTKNLKFQKGGVYTTPQGEKFQKVRNVNLFISIDDVKNI
jgi:hypothetical protein